MKGCIEAYDLAEAGVTVRQSIDDLENTWLVQWGKRYERSEIFQYFRSDNNRFVIQCSAVQHPVTDGTQMVGGEEVLDPSDQKSEQCFQRFVRFPAIFVHFVFVVVIGDKIRFVAADTLDSAIGTAFQTAVFGFCKKRIFETG